MLRRAPRVFRDKPKSWYAAEVLWKQSVVSSSHGPAAGGRRRASLSLLRLVGRRVDRRFYFGHLLPGAQRGRAGRRAVCAYVLLRNSFSGKWGSFAQQRPLALSSVRRLQPPCNVTVRRQDALAYLRALPCLAHQCIYADPPYIFPGRSMNYYGTRGGHDLVFHTELRDALFASGLPFVVSVNDVPEARELYSGADSITSLCSGKNTGAILLPAQEWLKQSCCHSRIDKSIPVPTPGLTAGRVNGEKTLRQWRPRGQPR